MPGHALSSSLVMLDDQAPAPRPEEACSEDGEPWLAISSRPENSWQDPRAEALAGPSQLTGVESPDDQPASRTLPEGGEDPAQNAELGENNDAGDVEELGAAAANVVGMVHVGFQGFDVAAALPRRIMVHSDTSVHSGRSLPVEMVASFFGVAAVPWGKEGDECSICLGVMVAGEEVTDLPGCNHTFHLQCAAQWLKTKVESGRSGCCPSCNAEIVGPVFSAGRVVQRPAPEASSCLAKRWKLLIVVGILGGICALIIFAQSVGGGLHNGGPKP